MTLDFAGSKILAHIADGVGRVVFNQPEKRNAMSLAMWEGLGQAVDRLVRDPAVRVLVLEGAGDKAFVSGADISQFEAQRGDAEAQRAYESLTASGRATLLACPKPVIAKIRGFCLGGGLGLAMSADLRIASEDSTFGIPAAKLGLAYGFSTVQTLTSLVGPANARMLLFTGDRIDAWEAERIGLVNEVVPVELLDRTVTKLAATIVANAPLTIRAAKLAVAAAAQDAGVRDMAAVQGSFTACFDSADYREGRRAFMEKRKPRFTGD